MGTIAEGGALSACRDVPGNTEEDQKSDIFQKLTNVSVARATCGFEGVRVVSLHKGARRSPETLKYSLSAGTREHTGRGPQCTTTLWPSSAPRGASGAQLEAVGFQANLAFGAFDIWCPAGPVKELKSSCCFLYIPW